MVILYITVTEQLPQNFQISYISFKVGLYIAVTLYVAVTLPFPTGDRCTRF